MMTGIVPQCSFEDRDFAIILAHMGLLFQTFLFSYLYSISNYEDKQPTVATHTLSEPLFGSHFGVLSNVLKVEF